MPGAPDAAPTRRLRVGEVELDLDGVLVRVADRRVSLTYREFLVLRTLMERAGCVVDRETLRRAVWGTAVPRPRVVDVYVRRVRARLGDGGPDGPDGSVDLERHIRTVRGQGYVFDRPVRVPHPRGAAPAR